MKNPFKNAKVVQDNVAAEVYIRQEPGILRGNPAYVMGRSSLVECMINPFRWVNGFEEQDTKTKATEWGTLVDALLLDEANFDKRFVVKPETVSATATMECVKNGEKSVGDAVPWRECKEAKDWKAANKHRIHVSHREHQKALQAVKMLRAHPYIPDFLDGARFQVLVVAEYHSLRKLPNGQPIVVPVKILIDLLPNCEGKEGRTIVDLKTARSANPVSWPKQVADYDYHTQAQFYIDVYGAAVPDEDRLEFTHIVQENVFPFVPELHALGQAEIGGTNFLSIGRRRYMAALEMYCACLERNEWPGFAPVPGRIYKDGRHYAAPEEYMTKREYYPDPDWARETEAKEEPASDDDLPV